MNKILPLLALIVVCVLFVIVFGCAHTCQSPKDRAATYGMVLECRGTRSYTKSGRQIERCLVSTKSGDQAYDFGACE